MLYTARRYDGATEAAVLRCVRLALGIAAEGTAHLLWKSGDMVDFGKPITDGATLYLDTTSAGQHSDGIVVADGSRSSPSFELAREGGGGLSQRRVQPPPREYESGNSVDPDARRPTGSATNSLLQKRLPRTLGESGTDRNSDDERRPLLLSRPPSLDHGQEWVPGESSPEGQRRTILKMKRINAHLANERTFLAWVRAMQKMFTAGGLSIELAAKGGAYGVCFVILGLAYIALCPLIVFIGGYRWVPWSPLLTRCLAVSSLCTTVQVCAASRRCRDAPFLSAIFRVVRFGYCRCLISDETCVSDALHRRAVLRLSGLNLGASKTQKVPQGGGGHAEQRTRQLRVLHGPRRARHQLRNVFAGAPYSGSHDN